MTQAEIEAIWVRYMHRADLEADLATTWTLASNKTTNIMLYAPVDFQEILDSAPEVMVHAGMIVLAELAQDDTQLNREMGLFQEAAGGWMMNQAIQTPAIIGS